MPPKKQAEKKVKKIVEDKTFGLKNKNKSKKVQQYIQNVATSAKMAGRSRKEATAEEAAKKARADAKKAAEVAAKQNAELFKTVVTETKVPAGVDPKSVLCEFFKAGKCLKGPKCKFSHDVNITMKTAKMDLYSDPREHDHMADWDQSKLESVIGKKEAGRMPPTDIVCKYFLDAIENQQYGWFWTCPNGPTCHYRHALPPGYILKTKKDKELEREQAENADEDDERIEDQIESERRKLDLSKCTPLTLELFLKWKEKKKAERIEQVAKAKTEAEKRGTNFAMSGRDLFTFDPNLFQDDEEADDEQYIIQEEDDEDRDDDKEEEEEEEGEALYDRDAQDNDLVDEKDEDNDDDNEEKKSSSAGGVATAGAINESLFLDDEDVPDDDDDDDDDDEKSS